MLFDAPETISIDDFFKGYLLKRVQNIIKTTDLSWLANKEFTTNYVVEGDKYGIKVSNGENVQIVAGGFPGAMVSISMTKKFWRDMATGKLETGLEGYMVPGGEAEDKDRFGSLQNLKGCLKVDIDNDGDMETVMIVLNNTNPDKPDAEITVKLEDWLELRRKNTDGPTLVMQGKMQFDGDLTFLLAAQEML